MMSTELDYHFFPAYGNYRDQAILLHHQRYQEVGFFQQDEADPYEALSTYFVAQCLTNGEVVGVTRLISDKLDHLPTLKNFHIYDIEKAKLQQLDRNRYAELSAFTKMPRHDVSLGLIRAVLHYCLQYGITHWILCVDERVFRYMTRMYRFPFVVVGEPKVYLGSTCIPCTINIPEGMQNFKVTMPKVYNYFFEGALPSAEVGT